MKLYSRYSLIRRMIESKNLAPVIGENLIVYQEKSAGKTRSSESANAKEINAHDLFNMYTADIIKKHSVFVR